MRIIITGCRYWAPEQFADRVILALIEKHGVANLLVVTGACPTGIDVTFANAAVDNSIPVQLFPADWGKNGKAAGPIRNQEMVDAGADLCLAFHPDLARSKGTGDCVRRALKAGIPTWWIGGEGFPPVRQKLADRTR